MSDSFDKSLKGVGTTHIYFGGEPHNCVNCSCFLHFRVGVRGPLPKSPTLVMTKIYDFPYPIYDQTKHLIPNLYDLTY